MAGFFKKIFSFGFGKKKPSEEEVSLDAIEDVAQKEKIKTSSAVVEKPSVEPPVKKPSAPKAKPKKTTQQPIAKTLPKANKDVVEESATKPKTRKSPEKKKPEQPKPIPTETKKPDITQPAKSPPKNQVPKPTGKIILDEPPRTENLPAIKPENTGWFNRLKSGLSRTSDQLTQNVTSIFTKRKLDDNTLQELEDVLIQADLGVDTAIRVTQALADQRYGKDVSDEEVREIMAAEIESVLSPVAMPLELDLDHKPHVILVIGVNGSGKTTTIGKLSAKLNKAGLSTLLVAGDTFRAAAIEQLKVWGERTGSPVASRELGSDAAGLAYDAYNQAKDGAYDIMLMDTAGRLQNKAELMEELKKIIRVLKKQNPDAPHTVLLTLDATTGQNALNQVEVFGKVAGVNGLVMTKLDGTARGGILVSISVTHKLPIYFIGVGEQVEDLEPFEAREFARSIAGLNE